VAESTPGPQSSWKVESMKNFSDTIGNQSRDLPACNTVPQPTAPLQAQDIPQVTSKFNPHCLRLSPPFLVKANSDTHTGLLVPSIPSTVSTKFPLYATWFHIHIETSVAYCMSSLFLYDS
jgi:hypothetical protein